MLVQYRGRPIMRGGYPVFEGRVYQRGRGFGSVLSSMFRNFVLPAAKNVGKNLLNTGLRKASGIMRNVADGQSLEQAVGSEFNINRAPAQPRRRTTKRTDFNFNQRGTPQQLPRRAPKGVNKKRKAPMKQRPAKRQKRDIFD